VAVAVAILAATLTLTPGAGPIATPAFAEESGPADPGPIPPADPPDEAPAAPGEDDPPPASEGAASRFPSEAPIGWAQAGRDLKYVYTRPAHLDKRGWAKVGWTLGSVAALYLVREEVAEGIRRNHNQEVENVLTTVRDLMGKVGSVGAVSVGYLWTGAARDSDYDKETAQILAESVLYALPIAGLGGRILATQRPAKGGDIGFVEGEGHSVSADVTVAASMLAPIIDRHLQPDGDDTPRRIFWKRFGTWSLYSLAGLVAAQRMYTDRHYLPDVVLGYANGLTIGRLIVDNHRGGREWRDRRRQVRIEPGAGGIRIAWGAAVAHD
jgi:hypothetical protein